ncbi:MAG: response regulator [Magnetococcus sp. DMHC-8]
MNRSEPANILAVDDMPINLRILDSILADEYNLFVTTDSRMALTLARHNRPDLILLDVMMPEMDGYAVCRQFKAEPDTCDIPIIFITSMSGEEDEVKGFAAGAVDYISKPFKPAVVLARVKTHLTMRIMRQELMQQQQELRRQNAALLAADQMKADMERIMRHDLKAPLASIISYTDLLLTTDTFALTEETHRCVQFVHDAGHHALRMISLSLDLYKMEQGTYMLVPQPVDLVQIIGRLVIDFSREAHKKGIPIHILIAGQPLQAGSHFWVLGEDLLCYSLFANLLKNALDASPVQQAITVSLAVQDGMATVAMHNAGEVPVAIQARFFEKYVTSGKKSGNGLGTYSARLMAEVQHGSMRMATSASAGTTLTVQLPVWSDA